MNKSIRKHGIATGAMVLVVFALTAGTRQSSPPPSVTPDSSPSPTTLTNRYADGMQPVTLHNLNETRLLGIQSRISVPGNDDFLPDFSNPAAAGAAMPMPRMPMLQQISKGDERGGLFDGLEADNTTEPDSLSWGWLADDVNATEPPAATPERESGGFGFSQSGGARLYDQSENRLGTRQGFGGSDSDAFIFQRRRDNRF